jgi:hypothetical protein
MLDQVSRPAVPIQKYNLLPFEAMNKTTFPAKQRMTGSPFKAPNIPRGKFKIPTSKVKAIQKLQNQVGLLNQSRRQLQRNKVIIK